MKTIPNRLEALNTQKLKPVFARHETFHPRFGWLKKGFEKAKECPGLFLAPNAPVMLGVGKNMVSSLRYWSHAFKILKEDKPSEFGQNLLSDGGWDPFLEDAASLWLLHWNLLKPVCEATSWYFMFNYFRGAEFTADNLLLELQKYRDRIGSKVVDSSLKKDVNCLLRMYAESELETALLEDTINCPFTELGLIQTVKNSKVYIFPIGSKNNLPPEIIVATCLEYAGSLGSQKTISISRLLYDEGSPGLVFRLSEEAIYDAIEKIAHQFSSISLSDTGGLIQLSFLTEPVELANDILKNYYHSRRLISPSEGKST